MNEFHVFDTTLRDGMQGLEINYTLEDKLQIAHALDDLKIDYIEGGFPLANEKEAAFFKEIRNSHFSHAKVLAFGSTRKPGGSAETDPHVGALLEAETPGVLVEQTDAGTRVTVQNIRFVPDQAVILLEERGRLGQIAEVLKSIQDIRFLVVGHTADVGTEESQMELSWQRAEVVVAELVRRGLDPMRFDVEGRGGNEPVASNDNETGRTLNRRVEIYLLEE